MIENLFFFGPFAENAVFWLSEGLGPTTHKQQAMNQSIFVFRSFMRFHSPDGATASEPVMDARPEEPPCLQEG
jgi:hypothetical protein